MTTERPRCTTCEWAEFDPAEQKGLCRVNPPNTFQGRDAIVACWPRIKATDWCGAHPELNVILAEAE